MLVAEQIVTFIQYYLIAGALVAAFFLIFGIERVEPGARGSFLFRPLLVPGLCMLWPLVLWRWYALYNTPGEH